MGGCFVGRGHFGKPGVRWENSVWKYDLSVLQIRNPKVTVKKRK
jgi:hypothetical protein